MKSKKFAIILILVVALTFWLMVSYFRLLKPGSSLESESVEQKHVSSQISASGSTRSQNEVTLHFQTPGKLVYLPFKEGDLVYQGQIIAQLDTYPLEKQLATALNNYRSTRDAFDQTRENFQTGVLQGTQKFTLETQNRAGISGQQETDIINNMALRILDQNQANLDNSVISVELSNYALQLATLISPIGGIITHEDVTVPFLNVTPQTSFTISDPQTLVFRANVLASDIDFLSIGSETQIRLDGQKDQTFKGTVLKIYPQRTVLPTGESVYQVDIESDDLKKTAKLGQNGSILIQSAANSEIILVPSWTILAHNFIWVDADNKPALKKVIIGKSHDGETEIIEGLSKKDRIIINPKSILRQIYKVL